jgi:HK97 family phage major capsid protein
MVMLNAQPISREDLGPLVVQPVSRQSVAISTSTNVTTDGHTFRVPIVTDDPAAAWVAEGTDIPASDAVLSEITVTPAKVAGLTVVSRELAEDSSPAAAQVVGDGIARDIARKVDQAWFGNLAAPAPPGLLSLTGIQTVTGSFANLDTFAEAISLAEQVGAQITAFVADPQTVLALSKIKTGTSSNEPLLGQDATAAGQRRILGVPLLSSPAIARTGTASEFGRVWAYDRSRVWTVLRSGVTLDVDRSRYFESDRVGVRSTMRVGFAFPHPASVVQITEA